MLLVIAGSAILLAVPRAVDPEEIPAPRVDGHALAATMEADDARAAAAAAVELDVDVRAVGRELRAFNVARHESSEEEMQQARQRLVAATARALALGTDGLLSLRAYQTVRFVAELERWREEGVESEELVALGGDIVSVIEKNGWCYAEGGARRLLPDARVLRAFYKKRWNDLVDVGGGPFALSLDEDRVRFGFLARHPLTTLGIRRSPGGAPTRERLDEEDRLALAVIDKLEHLDRDYPADLARGVVFFRMQRFGDATDALHDYLVRAPDGPYALRAQNYLKACLDRTTLGIF